MCVNTSCLYHSLKKNTKNKIDRVGLRKLDYFYISIKEAMKVVAMPPRLLNTYIHACICCIHSYVDTYTLGMYI